MAQLLENLKVKLLGWLNELVLLMPNLLLAVGIAVICYVSFRFIKRFARKTVSRFTENKTVLNLTANLSAMVFGILSIFLILSVLNLDGTINKILATAGVVGLAVGLALQNPMNNLFSGVFLSVRSLYRIGDLIESNGYLGTILDIDLKSTKLRLPTGQTVIIPNKDVLENPLNNYTVSGERRVDVSCGVSYGDDLEKVEEVAINAVKDLPCRLQDKPVDLVYNEFGDSSVNFDLRFWIETNGQADYLRERSNAIKTLKAAFDDNDIMIPFPIRTLDFGIRGGVTLHEAMPKVDRSVSSESSSWELQN